MFAHRYISETEYQVIEHTGTGERIIPHDQHDYLAWLALGNTPTIEAEGRFLSIVNGALVVDPNKASVLAAEEATRVAEEVRIAAKTKAVIDNLPSWVQVDTAVTNIANLADAKVFIRKLARIVYWLAKDKAE
jgi:hypothetical protein